MISDGLILMSWVLMSVGMVGLFRFKNAYARVLNNALIDSAAFIVLMLALLIKSGISAISIKLAVIVLFFMITNPIIAQMIAYAIHKETDGKEGS